MQNLSTLGTIMPGVGKIGPWFEYVNGPFMLQSRCHVSNDCCFCCVDFVVSSSTVVSVFGFGGGCGCCSCSC